MEANRTAEGTDFSAVLEFAIDALLARIEVADTSRNPES